MLYRSLADGSLMCAKSPRSTANADAGSLFAPHPSLEATWRIAMDGPTTIDQRPLLLHGNNVGLALMRREDIPAIARWNQDLEFTASIGAPGEAHTLEMRQEAFDKGSRVTPASVEFAVILLSTGGLIGFGGLFDISRAMSATLFVGIGERGAVGQGLWHRGDPPDLRVRLLLPQPLQHQGRGERLQPSRDSPLRAPRLPDRGPGARRPPAQRQPLRPGRHGSVAHRVRAEST